MGSYVLKLRGYGASFPGAPAAIRKNELHSNMAACRCNHRDTSNDNVDVAIVLVVVGTDVDVDADMENAC